MRLTENTIIKAVSLLIALAGIALPVYATETAQTRTSKSISYTSSSVADEASRKSELDQADSDVLDALVKEGFRTEAAPVGVYVETVIYDYVGDITIYDASTTLISDFDDDGFYHRFSITIDADYVDDSLGDLVQDEDLSRYIL